MVARHVQTLAPTWQPVRAQNSTDAFPARAWRLGRNNFPSGDGDAGTQTNNPAVLAASVPDGDTMPNAICLLPFGTDAADETFKMRLLSWKPAKKKNTSPETWLWVYSIIGEFTCTLGTRTGLANSFVGSTNLIADTIAIVGTSGDQNSYSIISPADNTVATLMIDIRGSNYVEVLFDTNSSSASANALYHWIY